MSGRIELIIGPMFASKSSELIKIANRYNSIKKNILAINHALNDRYGTNNISTHDNTILSNCLVLNDLHILKTQFKDLYDKTEIIIIEETQFFKNAFEFITEAADKDGKIVICAGLSGDFRREPFGDIPKLIPHAEKITKLKALCKFCGDGTPAHFSKLMVKNIENSDEQTIVGGQEKYEAVCRKHYHM